MIAFTGYAMLLLLNFANPAPNRRCFPLDEKGSLCFTQPDPPLALSWSSALQWCKSIGATLPIPDTNINNVVYSNAVGYFGLLSENLWLGANSTYDHDNWYWPNLERFTGPIENKYVTGKTHAYIVRNGNRIKFVAASPFDSSYMYIICGLPSYSELNCSRYPDSYWTDEKCFHKYRYSYSWYSYRSTCGKTNLASYEDVKKFSRWLDDSKKFWVELSCYWWTWQDIVTGTSREFTVTQFGSSLPSASSAQCLASYVRADYYYGAINWINLDCYNRLQFLCQQYVNDTTNTSTIKSSDWASTIGSIEPNSVNNDENDTTTTSTIKSTDWSSTVGSIEPISVNNGPTIWIGVGLGCGMFLAVTIWLAIITVYAYRKIRVATQSLIHLQRQSGGNQVTVSSNSCNTYTLDDESRRAEIQEADATYQALELQAKEEVYQPIKKKPERLADATPRFTQIQAKKLKK